MVIGLAKTMKKPPENGKNASNHSKEDVDGGSFEVDVEDSPTGPDSDLIIGQGS